MQPLLSWDILKLLRYAPFLTTKTGLKLSIQWIHMQYCIHSGLCLIEYIYLCNMLGYSEYSRFVLMSWVQEPVERWNAASLFMIKHEVLVWAREATGHWGNMRLIESETHLKFCIHIIHMGIIFLAGPQTSHNLSDFKSIHTHKLIFFWWKWLAHLIEYFLRMLWNAETGFFFFRRFKYSCLLEIFVKFCDSCHICYTSNESCKFQICWR